MFEVKNSQLMSPDTLDSLGTAYNNKYPQHTANKILKLSVQVDKAIKTIRNRISGDPKKAEEILKETSSIDCVKLTPNELFNNQEYSAKFANGMSLFI